MQKLNAHPDFSVKPHGLYWTEWKGSPLWRGPCELPQVLRLVGFLSIVLHTELPPLCSTGFYHHISDLQKGP